MCKSAENNIDSYADVDAGCNWEINFVYFLIVGTKWTVVSMLQLHHADLFEGVPYGLFLGPQVRIYFQRWQP